MKAHTEYLKVEIKNKIATITLSRPNVHNALTPEMINELTNLFLELDKDKNIRAVVLTGEGKSFCAGVDLNYMSSMINASYEENLNDIGKLALMFKTIYNFSKPIIGKINGSAFGGGIGLISVCDISISIEDSIFSLSEARIGLVPGVISPFVINKVGTSNANRFFITSERFSSQLAKDTGLINEVVKNSDELDKRVNEFVKLILENGPEAVSICKKLVREVSENTIENASEISKEYIAKCRVSKEGQEGMKAFLEKRKPNWI